MRKTLISAVLAVVSAIGLVAASGVPAEAQRGTNGSGFSLGYTQVVVAPPVYQFIAGAGIIPAAIDGATAYPYKGTLAANFPITGVSLRYLRISHSGGISLTAGARTIALRNFDIDLGRGRVSALVSGTVGDVGRVDVFKLRGTDRPDLGLVRLTLTSAAAGALDATFGVQAFAENATFGYATPRLFAARSRMRALLR